MKKIAITLAALALAANARAAVTYTDSTGDNFDANAHMDIASVAVDSTLTTITFTINLVGDPVAVNWGKYLVGISTDSGTGDTGSPVGNPWGRNINMADGMDAFIGTWVDSGGGSQAWTWSAGAWGQTNQNTPTITTSSVSVTHALADLGLAPGDTIGFDVYTSGGGSGDTANDAAANPNQTVGDWQVPYSTPASGAGGQLVYTIVPEPGAVALLGLLPALALLRRRR